MERPIWPNTQDVRVDLSAVEEWSGSIALDLGPSLEERFVEVFVQGGPRPVARLSPGEPLVLEGLVPGGWNVRVTSGPVDLLPASVVHVASRRCQHVALNR